MLALYDWIYGVAQLAAAFLAVITGLIAVALFKVSQKHGELGAWKYLIAALVLFSIEEVLGALGVFGVYSTPHLTHVMPSFILIFLIAALSRQISINRGWLE